MLDATMKRRYQALYSALASVLLLLVTCVVLFGQVAPVYALGSARNQQNVSLINCSETPGVGTPVASPCPTGGRWPDGSIAAAILALNPLRYYRFDELGPSYVSIADSSTAAQAASSDVSSPPTGKQAGLVAQDGSYSYTLSSTTKISIPTSGMVAGASDFSYAGLFSFPSMPASSATLLFEGFSSTAKAFEMTLSNCGQLAAGFYGTVHASSYCGAITTNTVYAIAVSFDGTNIRLYIDGVQFSVAQTTITAAIDKSAFYINASNSAVVTGTPTPVTSGISIKVDEFAWFDSTISGTDFAVLSNIAHYGQGPYPTPTGTPDATGNVYDCAASTSIPVIPGPGTPTVTPGNMVPSVAGDCAHFNERVIPTSPLEGPVKQNCGDPPAPWDLVNMGKWLNCAIKNGMQEASDRVANIPLLVDIRTVMQGVSYWTSLISGTAVNFVSTYWANLTGQVGNMINSVTHLGDRMVALRDAVVNWVSPHPTDFQPLADLVYQVEHRQPLAFVLSVFNTVTAISDAFGHASGNWPALYSSGPTNDCIIIATDGRTPVAVSTAVPSIAGGGGSQPPTPVADSNDIAVSPYTSICANGTYTVPTRGPNVNGVAVAGPTVVPPATTPIPSSGTPVPSPVGGSPGGDQSGVTDTSHPVISAPGGFVASNTASYGPLSTGLNQWLSFLGLIGVPRDVWLRVSDFCFITAALFVILRDLGVQVSGVASTASKLIRR